MIKHSFGHAVVLLEVRKILDGNLMAGLLRMCKSPNRCNYTPNWIKWVLFNSCTTEETVSVCESTCVRNKIWETKLILQQMYALSYSFTADASNSPCPLTTKLAMKVKTQDYFSSEDATSLAATVTARVSLFTLYMWGGTNLSWSPSAFKTLICCPKNGVIYDYKFMTIKSDTRKIIRLSCHCFAVQCSFS